MVKNGAAEVRVRSRKVSDARPRSSEFTLWQQTAGTRANLRVSSKGATHQICIVGAPVGCSYEGGVGTAGGKETVDSGRGLGVTVG